MACEIPRRKKKEEFISSSRNLNRPLLLQRYVPRCLFFSQVTIILLERGKLGLMLYACKRTSNDACCYFKAKPGQERERESFYRAGQEWVLNYQKIHSNKQLSAHRHYQNIVSMTKNLKQSFMIFLCKFQLDQIRT